MAAKYVILLFATFLYPYSSGQAPPAAPPAGNPPGDDTRKYELEIQKILSLNKTDFIVFRDLKVKRFNKTCYVADGQFSTGSDFDDDWKVEAWCWRSKLGNNQWELTPYKVPPSMTSDFLDNVYMPSLFKDVGPFSNLPAFGEDDVKVFPKGTYTITQYVADVGNFPLSLQDGTYRIEIFLWNEDEIKAGFVIYWKVYPEIG